MAHLGELIAELRQDKGLTQKELGDILCVSSGTISNYENGVHLPDVDKVIAVRPVLAKDSNILPWCVDGYIAGNRRTSACHAS